MQFFEHNTVTTFLKGTEFVDPELAHSSSTQEGVVVPVPVYTARQLTAYTCRRFVTGVVVSTAGDDTVCCDSLLALADSELGLG